MSDYTIDINRQSTDTKHAGYSRWHKAERSTISARGGGISLLNIDYQSQERVTVWLLPVIGRERILTLSFAENPPENPGIEHWYYYQLRPGDGAHAKVCVADGNACMLLAAVSPDDQYPALDAILREFWGEYVSDLEAITQEVLSRAR